MAVLSPGQNPTKRPAFLFCVFFEGVLPGGKTDMLIIPSSQCCLTFQCFYLFFSKIFENVVFFAQNPVLPELKDNKNL